MALTVSLPSWWATVSVKTSTATKFSRIWFFSFPPIGAKPQRYAGLPLVTLVHTFDFLIFGRVLDFTWCSFDEPWRVILFFLWRTAVSEEPCRPAKLNTIWFCSFCVGAKPQWYTIFKFITVAIDDAKNGTDHQVLTHSPHLQFFFSGKKSAAPLI